MGDINFPNLGIFLKNVGSSFSIGKIEVAFYGIIVALAMFLGVMLASFLAKRTGQEPDEYMNFAIAAIIVAVIGARLYYVLFSWDYYSLHPREIINIRGGGLAIYGGVIGGVMTAAIWSRIRHKNLLLMLDTAAAPLILGQGIGRWGNFFNREAFGEYTNSLFAMQLPVSDVNPADVTALMRDNEVLVRGVSYIQAHPTFLYESVFDILICSFLIFTLLKRYRFKGQVFGWYLLLYGILRFFTEGLRTDQLMLGDTGMPVSLLLSAVIIMAGGSVLVGGVVRERFTQN